MSYINEGLYINGLLKPSKAEPINWGVGVWQMYSNAHIYRFCWSIKYIIQMLKRLLKIRGKHFQSL